MSDSEEESPGGSIQLSKENWIILKEFLQRDIDEYLYWSLKCRCRECVYIGYGYCIHPRMGLCIDAEDLMQQFRIQRQKLLDQQ